MSECIILFICFH